MLVCLFAVGEAFDQRNHLKSKICEAIQQRKERAALSEVHQLFKLKDVSVLDCNQILQECWVHANGKVLISH